MAGGEQFVINVTMTGVGETEAGAGKVAAANREMGASAKAAGMQSEAASRTVSQRWAGAGTTMAAAGKKMTKYVTLPLVAVGAAAVKMSLDFQRSMLLVSTQAGASRKEVKAMTHQIEELGASGRFTQGPKEISEALFDIESVGVRGKKAMQDLKAASDFATLGNADLEASTSALVGVQRTQIKGTANLREEIGLLNAGIGVGKMHMEDLNAAIGTGFIGAAKGLGLSLAGVLAPLGELTSQGVPANSAATRLRLTFSLMANPTEKAAKALGSVGIGSEQLAHDMRSTGGIVTALEDIERHFKGLSEIEKKQLLSEAFGGGKSGGTIIQLIEHTSDLGKKQREIIDNAGHVNKALAETKTDPEVELAHAWSAIRFEMVKLGDVLIPEVVPALKKIGGIVTGLASGFEHLPDPMKSTVLEFLALAAVAGPILRLGGAFASLGSKVIEGMAAIKGAAIVGDLGAAMSLAMEGEAGAFAMVGAEAGTAIMGGLVTGLAVAAGAFAIANLLTSVLNKDFKDAGFELGGSLIGGVAGFMLGGPVGAAIGAGLGSVGGELVAGLFSDGQAEETMHEKLTEATQNAVAGRRHLARSSGVVAHAEKRLSQTADRQSNMTDQIRAAQKRLNAARDAGNLPKVRREEAHLNELKAKQIHLTHQQWREENLLHSAKVTNEADARRVRTTEVDVVRVRQKALELARRAESNAQKAFIRAEQENKPLKEQNEKLNDLTKAQTRRRAATEKLKGAEKELGASMKEITEKFGKKFTEQLKAQIPEWGSTAGQMKRAEGFLHKLSPGYQTLTQAIGAYKERQEGAGEATGKGATKLHNFGHAAEEAGGKVKQARTEVVGGFRGMESKSNAFLGALNVPSPFTAPEKAGGGLLEVQGAGNRDTVPLGREQIAAMVAPGELLAVINRHQAPLLNRAVHNEYGVSGLGDFFSTYDRPHHHAIGGLIEPQVRSGGAFRGGEQRDLHLGFKAAVKYLQAHDKYGRVVKNADRMDSLHQPYLWGGGHGATASPNGPWDCSGGISEMFDGGGWNFPPMVSGGFMNWGLPGKGKISVLASPDHVYSVFDTKGAAGTSDSNPGGGFGWINEYTFRPGFTIRHADLGHEAVSAGSTGRRGKGQAPKKGFASGGIAYLSAGGPVPPKGGELVGASFYGGPTDHVSGTTGAAGVALAGTSSFAELAMGHALGGLPFHSKLKVSRGGKSLIAEKLDIGLGGGDVAGHNRAIDLWFEPAAKLGISGLGVVKVEPAAGAIAGSGTAKPKTPKQSKYTFKGGTTSKGGGTFAPAGGKVPTAKLSFGSMPSTLYKVRKELGERRTELLQYRAAYARSKMPTEQAALKVNIELLVHRIRALLKEQGRLVQERHRQQVTRAIGKKGLFKQLEATLEADEGTYNRATEYAGQVTDLEPEILTADYAGAERGAFESELGSEQTWRNHLVGATRTAHQRQKGLEDQLAAVEKMKETDPKTYRKQKYRIKPLKEAIQAAAEAGQSFTESLGQVQGLSGPPGIVASIPATPAAGSYGGYIFETQKAIRDLDLRITSSQRESESASLEAKLAAEEERNRTLSRELAIEHAQRPVLDEYRQSEQPGLPQYLGAYEEGGILPATGYYLGHKGEQVTPADQVGVTPTVIHETHIHVSDELAPYITATAESALKRVGRSAGLGMSSPSAPGRRAVMRHGKRARP